MIITPIRPIAVAIQRRMPTFSLRKTIDSAVTNSGETKPVAEASAMGRKLRPVMKNSEEPSNAAPRINCRPRRSVRIANSGEPGSIAGVNISANITKRIQVISIDGRRRRQILRGDIGAAEKYRRQQHQRDALEGMIDARRRAASLLLLLRHGHGNTVEPCGCGGRRCHGWNLGKLRIRERS